MCVCVCVCVCVRACVCWCGGFVDKNDAKYLPDEFLSILEMPLTRHGGKFNDKITDTEFSYSWLT